MATSVKTDLLMARDPSSALHAATKQYVDAGNKPAFQFGYPVSGYGLIAATVSPDSVASVATAAQVTVNTLELLRIYVPPNTTITGACCYIGSAGVTPGSTNASGFAIYADDGSSQLAVTANDYTLFTATGWRSKAFTSPYTTGAAATWLRAGLIHTCTTVPKFAVGVNLGTAFFDAMVPSGSHRRAVSQTGVTAWPTSFTASTYGALDNPIMLMGLY